MICNNLKEALQKKGITLYRLAKLTGIRYELVRRVFCGERKLSADELALMLEKTGICFDEIK